MAKKLTQAGFTSRAAQVHNNKYDYSHVVYRSVHDKVIIVCPKHGVFEQRPNSHLRGQGCKECSYADIAFKKKDTKEDFLSKARQAHGDKYGYDKVEYRDCNTNVTITCPVHGDFQQKPMGHVSGKGCRQCGRVKIIAARKLTTEKFVKRATKLHEGKYDYSQVVYGLAHDKVKIICPKHGLFEQKACDHLQGRGCWDCGLERSSDSHRLEHSTVSAHFQDRQCVLLDEYTDSRSPLRYVCKCGKEAVTSWDVFKQGHHCKACGVKQAHDKTRRSQEEVEKVFSDAGCTLIDTYTTCQQPLKYICKCGKEACTSYNSFITHKRCIFCAHRQIDFQEVQVLFSDNGCVLQETEYKNEASPLKFTCKCGETDTRCWASIRSSGIVQCDKCAGIAKPSQEEVEELFEAEGCELLDVYINAHSPMKYICECGGQSVISLHAFKKGHRCKQCGNDKSSAAQRLDIAYIRSEFEKAGCVLLENEYTNSYQSLRYVCNCGEESQINWQKFRDGRRCRTCGKEKIKAAISGEAHYAWNPDREYVETRKKISARSSGLVRRCLKLLGKKKDSKTETLLGYSRLDLFKHITSHPNWDSVKDQDWHIDHVFPVKAFVEHGITDLKIINAIDNLRPLLGEDNLAKSGTYDKQEFVKYLKDKYEYLKGM